jgi:hypothetical protein
MASGASASDRIGIGDSVMAHESPAAVPSRLFGYTFLGNAKRSSVRKPLKEA